MIHFDQNNDIIIGVDFGYDNDIAVKTTAKVHEDGRLEILSSERIGRTRDQCLIVKQYPSSTVATNYVPDWNDMFAKDWMVL